MQYENEIVFHNFLITTLRKKAEITNLIPFLMIYKEYLVT